MVIPVKLSKDATEMVKSIMSKKGIPEDYCLRIGIKGGSGCLGVSYLLGFDKPKEGDEKFDINGIPVLIEKKHAMFLIGMKVDWVAQDGNAGFTFFKEQPGN